MKKLFSTLTLSVAALLFLGSCSKAYKTALTTDKLQYAQAVVTPVEVNTPLIASSKETSCSLPGLSVASPEMQPLHEIAPVKKAPYFAEKLALVTTSPKKHSGLKQRFAMKLVEKQMTEKIAAVSQKVTSNKLLKKVTAGKSGAQMDHQLKVAIVLILIGLILGAFYSVNNIFGLIGAIFVVLGLIFLLLWVLDDM